MTSVDLHVGPTSRSRPQRLVVAIAGAVEHRDCIDTNSAISRGRFIAALAAKLSQTPEDFPSLDAELVQAADEADATAESMAAQRTSLAGDEDGERKPSQSTLLVRLAHDQGAELFHNVGGDAYATFPVDGHAESHPVRGKAFKQWLAHEYYVQAERTPGTQALTDAMTVLEGEARYDGPEHPTPLRVAEVDDAVFVDLGDPAWRAVRIDGAGWRIVDRTPVRFRRAKALQCLGAPEHDGSLLELRRFVNVADDAWPLLGAWLVAAMRPRGPYPLLCLHAEQGSGKSTAAKMLRSLIDPNAAPLRSEPRDPRDLMIAANNGWVIALDNLSGVSGWLSDCLCRLSTGGGFSTRELYSDSDEVIFDAMRPVILTGIEEVCVRGDLIDRSLVVSLPVIPAERRRTESQLWQDFEEARPRILGGLLDAVSVGLRRLPTVRLDGLPRMADFAAWATAAEPALGLEPGDFMATYRTSAERSNETALEASPVAPIIRAVCADGPWQGTASELLDELERRVDDRTRRQRGWPTSARALSGILRRLAPNLRAVQVEVSDRREGHTRRRVWTVQPTRIGPDFIVRTSPCVRILGDEDPFADDADGADDEIHPHSDSSARHNVNDLLAEAACLDGDGWPEYGAAIT